jgi:hypothetical protein
LGAAGAHQRRQPGLAQPALAHRLGELPGDRLLALAWTRKSVTVTIFQTGQNGDSYRVTVPGGARLGFSCWIRDLRKWADSGVRK